MLRWYRNGMMFIRSTSHKIKPNYIQINWKLCEIISAVFAFYIPVTLNPGQVHLNQYRNVEYSSGYHHFETYQFINIQMHTIQ